MAGLDRLDPAIPLWVVRPCHIIRIAGVEPGDDNGGGHLGLTMDVLALDMRVYAPIFDVMMAPGRPSAVPFKTRT
jgi:hypothetical protein